MGYGTPKPRASLAQVARVLRRSWPALSIPVIVIGGIRFGYFTPTEAGAIAVLIALFLGTVVYKEQHLRDLPSILARTAIDTGVIMMIISLSAPFSVFLAYHQIPQQIAGFFASFTGSDVLFLLAVNLFLLAGGALMEGVTLLVMATPLLAPAAARLGIDPIHFGMVVVFNVVLGSVTPPFGQLVFIVSSITGIRTENIFTQVFQFLPLLLLVLCVVTYLPGAYLWTVPLLGP